MKVIHSSYDQPNSSKKGLSEKEIDDWAKQLINKWNKKKASAVTDAKSNK